MSDDNFTFGPFRIDRDRMRLLRDGRDVTLRHQAVQLLCALVERAGIAASYEDLALWAWELERVEKGTVRVTVNEVRKALGDDYKGYIKTVKDGYLFERPEREYKGSKESAHKPRSVVLSTFVDASGAKDKTHLATGITSELATTLSRIGSLSVVKATPQNMQFLGSRRLAEPAYLIEGSVAVTGEKPRIHVDLLRLPSREIVWNETYQTSIADLQRLQSRIAVKIAEAIKLKVNSVDANKMLHDEEVDGETYELYLRGVNHWTRPTERDLSRAIEYFLQATSRQPKFSKAFGAMAHAYGLLGLGGYLLPDQVMPEAKSAALKCLDISPDSPEGLAGLAAVEAYYLWNWKGAEELLKRVLALHPNYETGHHLYAMCCLMPQARLEEALREIRSAWEINPLSPFIVTCVGIVQYYSRDFKGAVEQFDHALEMHPTYHLAHWHRGWALAELGRFHDAIEAVGAAVEWSHGSPQVLAAQAQVLAAAGKVKECRRILCQLKRVAAERYVSPYDLALVHISLGEHEKALRLLRSAVEQRAPMLARLRVHPLFDRLNSEPGFLDLLSVVNLRHGTLPAEESCAKPPTRVRRGASKKLRGH